MNKWKFLISFATTSLITTSSIVAISINSLNKTDIKNESINFLRSKNQKAEDNNFKTIDFLNDFRTFAKRTKYTNYKYNESYNWVNTTKEDINLVHNESKLKLKTQRLDKWYDWNWNAYLAQHNQLILDPLTSYTNNDFVKNINSILRKAIQSVYINPNLYNESGTDIRNYISNYGDVFWLAFKKYMWGSINYKVAKFYKQNNNYGSAVSDINQLGSNSLHLRPEFNPSTAKSSFYSYSGPTNYINEYILGHTFDTINGFTVDQILQKINNPFYTQNIYNAQNDNLKYSFNEYYLKENNASQWEENVNYTINLNQNYRIYDDSINSALSYNNTNPNILFQQNNNGKEHWQFDTISNNYYLYKFNVLNSFQNIYINFSNLFQFDTSGYYDSDNNWWTKSPKISLKLNEEIFNAFKEQADISNLMIKVFDRINEIFKFNNSLKTNFINFINDVYSKKIGLTEINSFLDQLKNSNGTNLNYNSAPSEAVANYEKILIANGFNSKPNSNYSLSNKMNEISNWRLIYEQCLTSIFSNDIYVSIQQNTKNGTDSINHKIYDGTTKQFIPYEVKSYGTQADTYNNEVNVNVSKIYIQRSSTNEIISGWNATDKTLSITNIAKATKLNSNATLNNDSIDFKFSYNPDLKPIKIPTTNNYSIINCGDVLVSDIDDYMGKLYFLPMYQEQIGKVLQIPESIWSKYPENVNCGNNWTNSLALANPFVSDISNVPENIISSNPDLKKFIDFRSKWGKEKTTIGNDPQNVADALKQWNDLGYFYGNFVFYFPLEYYIPNQVWTKLTQDGSIIKLQSYPDRFIYAFKFDTNGRMLDYKNLENYIKIKPAFETNCAEAKINNIQNDIKNINNTISNLQNQLSNELKISNDLIGKQKQLIQDIQNEFNSFMNSNPILANKYNSLLNQYNNAFTDIKNKLNNSYNNFEKDDGYVSKDLVYLIKNKTFNYIDQLKQLENINITTGNQVIGVLNENPGWINIKNNIIQKYNDYNNLVDLNKQNIQKVINDLTLESNNLNTKINELNLIDEVDYYYDQAVEFDIAKMVKDTNVVYRLNDLTSSIDDYYTAWIGNKGMLAWWFSASNETFAAKLNSILKQKTGIDFGVYYGTFQTDAIIKQWIPSTNQVPPGFESDHMNDPNKHEHCHGNGFMSSTSWYWFQYEQQKNRVKKATFHITIEVDLSLKTRNANNNAQNTIGKIQDTINKIRTIQSQLNTSIQMGNQQLNNYSNLLLQPNKTLIEIKNQIQNYKPITSYNKKIDIGAVSGISVGILVLIGLCVGLGIYIKSKKQVKLQPITEEDKQAIEEHKKWEDEFFK